jgi:Flp pilus assembly protein TadG
MNRPRASRYDGRDDPSRGSVLVETAIVSSLLFLLLFGIVTFGLLLAYRQNMVNIASDAARAGAVAESDEIVARAEVAAESAASAFDRSCADDLGDGLVCQAALELCPGSATDYCVHVVVTHSNVTDPIVAPLPLVSEFVPDVMRVEAFALVSAP